MIFTQQVNINNMMGNQEFMKICSEHLECKDCQLETEDVQLQSGLTTCITGRTKGETE